MTWIAPMTAVPGQILTAELFNEQVRDGIWRLQVLRAQKEGQEGFINLLMLLGFHPA